MSFALERLTSPEPVPLNPSVNVPRGAYHPDNNCQGGKSRQGSQSGFTIIESLVAIIVVTILMIGLAPVITLSVATRVQAKRVELATQAARSYLDGVRTGAIPFGPTDTGSTQGTHKAITRDAASRDDDNLNQVAPPTKAAPNCPANRVYCTSPTSNDSVFYCVDGDGGGCRTSQDFIIQAFGKITTSGIYDLTGSNREFANQVYPNYKLGVRVYRADSFISEFTEGFTAGSTQSSFTGGTGISKEQAPLVIMSTEIPVKEDQLGQYRAICTANGITGGC